MGPVTDDVLTWLLDSDPAIRWQVLRDLTGAPAEEVTVERARITETGWGRRLLDLADHQGWARGACFPGEGWRPPGPVEGDPEGQPWTATLPTLRLLHAFGVDPADAEVRDIVARVHAHCRWEYDDLPFFSGEVEPCINGGALVLGAWFGADHEEVSTGRETIVERLVTEQLADGGWNCEAERGSTRSSFHSTICALEGLLAHEQAGGGHDVAEARRRGEEYLLTRHLMHRASTGEVVDDSWLALSFPTQWHYDVLRGLEYFRSVGGPPDERLADAAEHVRGRRRSDGRWLLENTHPGLVHFAMERDGEPSRWNTLRALRSLAWYDAG